MLRQNISSWSLLMKEMALLMPLFLKRISKWGLFEATATLQSKAPCRLSWLSAPVMSGFAPYVKDFRFYRQMVW